MHLTRRAGVPDPRWYVGVYCNKCQAPIVYGVDHTSGGAPVTQAERLLLTCADSQCRNQADYSKATVTLFQKNADSSYEERSAVSGKGISK
jgi:hypothetical protein